MSVNRVILLGYVGTEPEVRYFDPERMRVRIRLATNEFYRDKAGNRQTHTEWHTVTFWGGAAKMVEQYVRKGNQLYIEGRLRHQRWQDHDGLQRSLTEVQADTFRFVNGPGAGGTSAQAKESGYGSSQQGGTAGGNEAAASRVVTNEDASALSETTAQYHLPHTEEDFPF